MVCANVANLFLARCEARRGELAMRAALGESSGRLGGSLLLEGLALGVAGGGAALLLAPCWCACWCAWDRNVFRAWRK